MAIRDGAGLWWKPSCFLGGRVVFFGLLDSLRFCGACS